MIVGNNCDYRQLTIRCFLRPESVGAQVGAPECPGVYSRQGRKLAHILSGSPQGAQGSTLESAVQATLEDHWGGGRGDRTDFIKRVSACRAVLNVHTEPTGPVRSPALGPEDGVQTSESRSGGSLAWSSRGRSGRLCLRSRPGLGRRGGGPGGQPAQSVRGFVGRFLGLGSPTPEADGNLPLTRGLGRLVLREVRQLG